MSEQTFAEKVVEAIGGEQFWVDLYKNEVWGVESNGMDHVISKESFDRLLAVLMKAIEQRDFWIELMSLGKNIEMHRERLRKDNAALLSVARGQR